MEHGHEETKICFGCMEAYDSKLDTCPHCGVKRGAESNDLLHLQPGTLLKEKYIVGKTIGYGTFGVTYIGFDTLLKRKVAIKEYFPSEYATRDIKNGNIAMDSSTKKRAQFTDGKNKFLKEGQKLAEVGAIEKKGVVDVYENFEENGTAYTVTEYLKGEALDTYLEKVGKMDEEEAISLMMPVMESLEKIHAHDILHRDIAPENIFVVENPDGTKSVKLIDFGAAKFATASHSKSLTVIIKPGYSPEEQYRSSGDQGPHTDVYALGAVLYRMITGEIPPDALERRTQIETKKKDLLQDLDKFNKDISANRENAILNAMNVRIEDRTATISDFIAELTTDKPVKRRGSSIRKIDFMKWPLWAKISVPVGAVAAIAVVIFALVKVFSDAEQTFTMPEGMTYVPDFVSADFDTAQEWASEATLLIAGSGSEYVPNVIENIVLSQDQTSGDIVVENTQVNVVISSGKETYAMPDVVGYTQEYATKAIECMGATVEVVEGTKDGVAEGCVISQDVKAYDEVNTGDVVKLTVNKKATNTGVVPMLEGMTYTEAVKAAAEADVSVVVASKIFSNSYKNGEVISQSFEEGSETAGNSVEIQVAMSEREFNMPNLLYKEKEVVEQLLENIGVTVEFSEEENEIIAKGLVAGQDLEKDSAVKPGATIKVSVSKGGKPFEMPNVVGMSEADAKKQLSGSGLAVMVEYGFDENVPEGNVMSQGVDAGTSVVRGTEVTITVCTTEGIAEVQSVVGMSRSEAISALQAAGFEVQVNEIYSDAAEGRVVSQIPRAGSMQKEGSLITITVSRGQDPSRAKADEPEQAQAPDDNNANNQNDNNVTDDTNNDDDQNADDDSNNDDQDADDDANKDDQKKDDQKKDDEPPKEETKKPIDPSQASWSAWSTAAAPSGDYYVESKTQYRTKKTATVNDPNDASVAGWVQEGEPVYSDYSDWSSAQLGTAPEDTECEDYVNVTVYRYKTQRQEGWNYGDWQDTNPGGNVEEKPFGTGTYEVYHYCRTVYEGGKTKRQSFDTNVTGDCSFHYFSSDIGPAKGWDGTTLWNKVEKCTGNWYTTATTAGGINENTASNMECAVIVKGMDWFWHDQTQESWPFAGCDNKCWRYFYKEEQKTRYRTKTPNMVESPWSEWQESLPTSYSSAEHTNAYKTRTRTATYTFVNISDWSDAEPTPEDGTTIESQTVTRYAPMY